MVFGGNHHVVLFGQRAHFLQYRDLLGQMGLPAAWEGGSGALKHATQHHPRQWSAQRGGSWNQGSQHCFVDDGAIEDNRNPQ